MRKLGQVHRVGGRARRQPPSRLTDDQADGPQPQCRAVEAGIDLDPKNPRSYLRAADAMNELGKPDQALAFCKRAAAIEPNAADPYSQSLVYLTSAKTVDSDAVQWAAGNLMRRDWATDRLVPDVISGFVSGRSATIRNPNAIRPWRHVLEASGQGSASPLD